MHIKAQEKQKDVCLYLYEKEGKTYSYYALMYCFLEYHQFDIFKLKFISSEVIRNQLRNQKIDFQILKYLAYLIIIKKPGISSMAKFAYSEITTKLLDQFSSLEKTTVKDYQNLLRELNPSEDVTHDLNFKRQITHPTQHSKQQLQLERHSFKKVLIQEKIEPLWDEEEESKYCTDLSLKKLNEKRTYE